MSKKSLLIVFLIALFLPIQVMNVVASTTDTVTETPSVSDPVSEQTGTKLADVTGVVLLKAQRKKFPDNLLNLFTGSSGKLPKQRKLKVSGEYKGGSVVTVVEVAKTGEPEFSFEIPVISSVMSSTSTKLVKETSKVESVTMTFTNANNVASVVDSASHKFISKSTSKRLSNKATASGSFTQQGAKGRFALKLDFDIE
ncbi:MAG: hypothetical protein OXU45_01085 [Candidatus Melainabacteria bacterium]|nr:hypothetical protein [Candidatus Melainabacteria bacterium]